MIERNEIYQSIADKLLRLKEFDEIRPFASYVVLSSDEGKKKQGGGLILGQCIRVNKIYEWCCPYDFMIVIYDSNVVNLSDRQLRILIRHEMHHMGYDMAGNEPTPFLVPHDYEEFEIIMRKFGIDWAKS